MELTEAQREAINTLQRVAREILPEGASFIGFNFYNTFECVDIHHSRQVFCGRYVRSGEALSISAEDALAKLKLKIKSPEEVRAGRIAALRAELEQLEAE